MDFLLFFGVFQVEDLIFLAQISPEKSHVLHESAFCLESFVKSYEVLGKILFIVTYFWGIEGHAFITGKT